MVLPGYSWIAAMGVQQCLKRPKVRHSLTNLVKLHSGYINSLTGSEQAIAETWIVKFWSTALCVSEQVYRGSTKVLLNRRYVSPTVSKPSLAAT